jgi:hypothetical protein
MRSSTFSLAAALLLAKNALSHTWNEQFRVIDEAGNYTGNYGYPRGYVSRTDPAFNGDAMNYLLPPLSSGRTRINSDDLLCHPNQRAQAQSSDAYPRLKTAPGSFVAMRYLENGHVSFPHNQIGKPPMGGTVFVFGTTKPKSDEKITDVLEWTRDGTGGDQRGKLLTAQTFDDGRCHQNTGASPIAISRMSEFPDYMGTNQVELWCETDLQLPSDLQTGTYSIYWVWQWPTAPNMDPNLPNGKDEYYTTCSDFDIVSHRKHLGKTAKFQLLQQDPMPSAVSNYHARSALTQHPIASNTDGIQIPTLTAPPGAPTAAPDFNGFLVVTVTERITVTVDVYQTPAPRPRNAVAEGIEADSRKPLGRRHHWFRA